MRKKAGTRKREIVEAAIALFEQNGFEATSVDDITAKAKVSKGLAYHYFSSKEEILLEIIRVRLDELDDLVARMQAEASAERRLKIIVGQLVDEVTLGEKRQRFLVTTFLQAQHNKLVARAMKAAPERFQMLHNEEIRLLADLGWSDPAKELPLFRAAMQGMVFLYLLNPAGFPLKSIAKQFIEKYLKKENV